MKSSYAITIHLLIFFFGSHLIAASDDFHPSPSAHDGNTFPASQDKAITYSSAINEKINARQGRESLLLANQHGAGTRSLYSQMEQSWKQIGVDLYVDFTIEFFERKHSNSMISLSDDGSTIAIGSPGGAGSVRMYKNVNSTWVQMGADIVGDDLCDGLGTSVSLSTDGKTVAIGAPYDDGYDYTSGLVRVFTYDDVTDAWEQKGEDIDGEEMFFYSGQSVSLSANGNTVAIGHVGGMRPQYYQAFVRVYDFNADSSTGSWEQKGQAIGDISGSSVSLAADGNTIALAGPFISQLMGDTRSYYNGPVRVFSYSVDTESWEQKGQDINDENEFDLSGYPVSLSADGSAVAIGSFFTLDDNKENSSLVRVYSYDDDTDDWEQRGRDIEEEELENTIQQTVSLSADGSIVAVGYPSSNEVRAYVNKDGDTWQQLGDSIKGKNEGQTQGNAVSLVENDGKVTLAVGSFNEYTSVYEITVPETTKQPKASKKSKKSKQPKISKKSKKSKKSKRN